MLGPLTYRLKLPLHWKIHDTFHATLLSPYKETNIHGPNFIPPPPDIIDGEEYQEIDFIIKASKGTVQTRKYLIQWKGETAADESWEPCTELMKNASDIVLEFDCLHNLAT